MPEYRNIRCGGSPKNLRKHFRVSMYQDVSHADYGIPGNLRVILFILDCWKFTLSMNSATFFAASRISSRRPGSLYGSLINQDFIMIDAFPGKWLDGSVDDEIDGFSYSVFQL